MADGAYPSARGERPWEQPGAVRRDCGPHRGGILKVLGTASAACGAFTLTMGVTGLVALPLGIATWVMARRDLSLMRAGRMDPGGRVRTEVAGQEALLGAIFGLVGLALWASLLLLVAARH